MFSKQPTISETVASSDVPTWVHSNHYLNNLRILENEIDPFSNISELDDFPDLEDFPF